MRSGTCDGHDSDNKKTDLRATAVRERENQAITNAFQGSPSIGKGGVSVSTESGC